MSENSQRTIKYQFCYYKTVYTKESRLIFSYGLGLSEEADMKTPMGNGVKYTGIYL